MEKSEIRIYKTQNGNTSIEVKLDKETVWLNQYQLETLFQTDRTSINRHIRNIYKTKELDENRTCAIFAQVQKEGKRTVKRTIKYYNSLNPQKKSIKNINKLCKKNLHSFCYVNIFTYFSDTIQKICDFKYLRDEDTKF